MDAHQVSFKIYFDAPSERSLEDFIPVFHRWIQGNELEDEVMIDVADYAHVPDGPGVLLVCHEGHYVVEKRGGRWGLVYNRKRGSDGAPIEERLAVPFRRLMTAAKLLCEDEVGRGLKFDTGELRLQVQDRLRAPNEDATFERVEPELRRFLTARYGAQPSELVREGESREMFTVRVRSDERPAVEALAAAAG